MPHSHSYKMHHFRPIKNSRGYRFADIVQLALEKRQEICQTKIATTTPEQTTVTTTQTTTTAENSTKLPNRISRCNSTNSLTTMPITESRKSARRNRSLHRSPSCSNSGHQGLRNVHEGELRKEVSDLLDDVENNITGQRKHTANMVVDLGGLELPMAEGELSEVERIFLYAAEQGDLATIKHLTDEASKLKLNLNCTDALGRDVIRIAIENEHLKLLEFLVALPKLDLKDCILHAINEDNVAAVEIILQAQNERASKKDLKGLLGRYQSSSFTPDISGIILAAHRDNYVILKMLLDRGDRIQKPHDLRCACNLCTQARREDGLQHSKLRINTYRALTSPSFIILTSNDPILTAFELCWELTKLGELENEFRGDYEELAAKCQDFATEMLAQTRSSAELSVVLNHDTGSDQSGCHVDSFNRPEQNEDGNERLNLSRLKLAIRYQQKKFVAHPHCQQLLATIWYEGLPGFRQKPMLAQLATIGTLCAMFPVLAVCYMLFPNSKLGRMMKKPFIKFLCHSSSYVSFLGLLILAAVRIEFILTDTLNHRMNDRGPLPSLAESALIIYVFGFVWQQMKKLYTWGIRAHIADMWNLVDFTMNSLYISTIALRSVARFRIEFYKEPRYVSRSEWDSFDPILVSECLFAAANIVSTLKLVYVFTVSPQLGPLQISLGRMLYDIFRFFCVYFLVLVAFAFGLNQLYWFYANNRAKNCKNVHFTLEEGQKDVYDYCITRGTYFTNLFEIVQSLYWSAYGLIDLTNFNLEYPHAFTEFVGKLTFGAYSYIAFIVLLNMLIAMMNSSYEQIVGQVDIEWKFARSKLWVSYFAEGCTVPVPFNIIPTPKSFVYLLKCIKRLFTNCRKEDEHRNNWETIRLRVKQVKEREARYQVVMREITKRYIMQKLHSTENDSVSADDLNEIKGDISSFRYELLDILKTNGMKIPEYHKTISKLRRGRDTYQLADFPDPMRPKKGNKSSLRRNGKQNIDENSDDVGLVTDADVQPTQPGVTVLANVGAASSSGTTTTTITTTTTTTVACANTTTNNTNSNINSNDTRPITKSTIHGGPLVNPAFEGDDVNIVGLATTKTIGGSYNEILVEPTVSNRKDETIQTKEETNKQSGKHPLASDKSSQPVQIPTTSTRTESQKSISEQPVHTQNSSTGVTQSKLDSGPNIVVSKPSCSQNESTLDQSELLTETQLVITPSTSTSRGHKSLAPSLPKTSHYPKLPPLYEKDLGSKPDLEVKSTTTLVTETRRPPKPTWMPESSTSDAGSKHGRRKSSTADVKHKKKDSSQSHRSDFV